MAKQAEPATAGASPVGPGSAGTNPASATGTTGSVTPFVSQVPGTPVSFPSYHGRPVSWFAVSLIMAAFLVGGLGLVFSVWVVFWIGVALGVVGLLLAIGVNTFDDWY